MAPAGLIGALIGLVVGWVDYRIVGRVVEGKLRDTDKSATPAEKADFERRIVWFHRLLLPATLGFFAVVGFVLGRMIGA